jgi:membrane fusion protein, macrolide-specific efflux system
MTNINRWKIYAGTAVVIVAIFLFMRAGRKPSGEVVREIQPVKGSIQATITSTATVQPQNRLEVKPPINGRIDEILVTEGEMVKTGQTLAWMSSTERAAILDAARAYGIEKVKYWADVYKPTPLIAPIDGQVIVSTDEPGQTVTSSEAVVVLSDRLIVQAQVDETDVGKVRVGQGAVISLDAYPEIKVKGKVDHIYYESKIINNVTIYQVDILPETTPEAFRSGMSATVDITEAAKQDVLTLPLDAIKRGKEGPYVMVSRGAGKKPEERKVELGLSDDKNAEIISGLAAGDRIIETSQKFLPASTVKSGTNPFMPSRRGR